MLYQYQKWHFFKCKCITAKKCPFLTTWTIVTWPTHMIFTQKVLPQVELIRSNFPDQKTFDQWLIISRKHPVTLRKKKLHPDLGYTVRENKEGSKNFVFVFRVLELNDIENWSKFKIFHALCFSDHFILIINNVTVLQWKLMFLTLYNNYKLKTNDFHYPNHGHIYLPYKSTKIMISHLVN